MPDLAPSLVRSPGTRCEGLALNAFETANTSYRPTLRLSKLRVVALFRTHGCSSSIVVGQQDEGLASSRMVCTPNRRYRRPQCRSTLAAPQPIAKRILGCCMLGLCTSGVGVSTRSIRMAVQGPRSGTPRNVSFL